MSLPRTLGTRLGLSSNRVPSTPKMMRGLATAARVSTFTPSYQPGASPSALRLDETFFSSNRIPSRRGLASASDSQMRMLIVGCPGSGKGTQSSRLLKQFSFTVISAGDVLRSHIQRGTEIGKRADKVIKAGGLMPDEIMMDLIGSEVEALGDSNWLLDGFPRTLGQAQLLDSMLQKKGKQLKLVVNLDVPEDVILDRILQRWTHLPSGRVYNLSFNPPKVAGKDDVTGEPLVQREDDNAETFSKRLGSFHKQTEPMLQHYRSASGDILDVDTTANATPEKGSTQLYVNFKGHTSDQIWPHLLSLVKERFPSLKPAAASSS